MIQTSNIRNCAWCGKDLSLASNVTYLNGNQPVCDLCLIMAHNIINAKLLEALKAMIGILTPKQYERQFPHVYQKARQAIAEAEGKE